MTSRESSSLGMSNLNHEDLPNELWGEIFRHLAPLHTPALLRMFAVAKDSHLHVVSRTCKRMRALAASFLFRTARADTPSKLAGMVALMSSHPEIARYLKHLELYECAWVVDAPGTCPSQAQQMLFAAIRDVAEMPGRGMSTVHYYGALPTFLRMPDLLDAFAGLFRGATEIAFHDGGSHGIRAFKADKRAALDIIQSILTQCPALKFVHLSNLNTRPACDISPLAPSLRHFSADGVQLPPAAYAQWLRGAPGLQCLRIEGVEWAGEDFATLIAAFSVFGASLRSLTMGQWYSTKGHSDAQYLTWSAATTAMVQRCPALEELRLYGVCYHAGIVRHLPKTLRVLSLDQMEYGGARVDGTPFEEFADGLAALDNLKFVRVLHDYPTWDTRIVLKMYDNGAEDVIFTHLIDEEYGW